MDNNYFNLITCQNIEILIEIEIDYKINFILFLFIKLKENLSRANSILFIYFLRKRTNKVRENHNFDLVKDI